MAIHNVIRDDGVQFQIVPSSRKIIVPQSHRTVGTVGSHNSEQVIFKCPKVIDGHNVFDCSDHYVDWINAKGNDGSYKIKKDDIKTDDEYMYLPWVLDLGVTPAAGAIKFAVHFEDKDELGALIYAWGTATCEECQILGTVRSRSGASVPVPDGYMKIPTATREITANNKPGEPYNVKEFAYVDVKVPEPEGTIYINANSPAGGTDVSKYATAVVNVPSQMEEGYIKPNKTVTLPENGTYTSYNGVSIAECSQVKVAVPVPKAVSASFTKNSEPGKPYKPKDGEVFDSVEVAVPNVIPDDYVQIVADTYPTPITENGTYIVTNYRKVTVAVPQNNTDIPANYHYIAPGDAGIKLIDTSQLSDGATIDVTGYHTIKLIIPEYDGDVEFS